MAAMPIRSLESTDPELNQRQRSERIRQFMTVFGANRRPDRPTGASTRASRSRVNPIDRHSADLSDGERKMTAQLVLRRFVRQKLVPFLSKGSKEGLVFLKDLIEAGKITPVLDRTYPLSDTAAPIRYLETGHARAKVVITL
jgi:hypothetical protein